MDLRGSMIYGSPNENPKCASVSCQGLPGKEPQNPNRDVNLRARPVLGNITNNPEISTRCSWPASRSKATTKHKHAVLVACITIESYHQA
ncbi:hypothetical protein FGIG_07525 [Fasciola gigantica]|uniref:Uncharacterized protein n=1 Tax=Fasciola gigantica TaxID=46835 RepID=A0A504YM72_FASGI|nr:hypothetical protein FGIG_07525 [Fasciola gigantica]